MNSLGINDNGYGPGLYPNNYRQPEWENMIDPQLDPNFSPETFPDEECWNSLPMQRFILGSSSQTHQNATSQQPPPGYALPLAAGHVDYLFDLPPVSNRRGGSPFSQHQSSTCSSGQSPSADAELYLEGLQGPSTPQDMAVASPYITQNQYDHWDGQYARSTLVEGPYNQGGGCVNPSALAPPAVTQYQGFEETNNETLDRSREHNFDSPNSSSHYETGSSDLDTSPHLSSSNLHLGIRDEIHVKSYPSLPLQCNNVKDTKDEPLQNRIGVGRPQPYGGLNGAKQLARRKRNSRAADPSRRGLLKRRYTDNQSEQARNNFTSHGVPSQRLLSSFPNGVMQCDQCSASFKDETLLRKHKRTEHIRPFICVFHYAGCPSSFAAKNEWKRHVLSQHLSLSYWLCTHGTCANSKGPSTHQRSALLPPAGVIFNRKDLFTQHIRRMHSPEDKDSTVNGSSPQVEERLKLMQEEAVRRRCELPTYMRCPAQNCSTEFRGANAWDERMEHVARHLEAAAVGDEPPVHFGGHHDSTLTCWAEAEGVEVVKRTAIGWEICNPLKGEGGIRKTSVEGMFGVDQDAEGEAF